MILVASRTKGNISRLRDVYGDPNPTDLTTQLLSNPLSSSSNSTGSNSSTSKKLKLGPISKQVQLNSPATLFGLYERIVAIESLKFLKTCFKEISARATASKTGGSTGSLAIASSSGGQEKDGESVNQDLLKNFFSQIIDLISDLRTATIGLISRKLINASKHETVNMYFSEIAYSEID
jgi:hypothetical protein